MGDFGGGAADLATGGLGGNGLAAGASALGSTEGTGGTGIPGGSGKPEGSI